MRGHDGVNDSVLPVVTETVERAVATDARVEPAAAVCEVVQYPSGDFGLTPKLPVVVEPWREFVRRTTAPRPHLRGRRRSAF
jgi:hypothetical protein